ncbi:MAG: hypothetical protein JO202_12095 [Ktedonobacteraceae bacterium]|nr:hypothetical protein [Ktedonobacteraceae bacterium]
MYSEGIVLLSAVITTLLLMIMLLIIASFLVGAWSEQRRQRRSHMLRLSTSAPNAALLQLQGKFAITLPSSWYARRRTFVSLGLLLMVLLTFLIQDGLAGETLHSLGKGIELSFLHYSHPSSLQLAARSAPLNASVRLVRVDSGSPLQYYNSYQLHVWAYSSCSGIAMEEVMNAYGRHLIAADVLQEELKLGVWNVQLGLLGDDGIAMTASYFGFDTSASHTRPLQDIIDIANKGAPVIVSVRDSYYFPGGHLFVVRGGDSQYVSIADSSPADFQRMSRAMFVGMWQGFSAVLSPSGN